MNGLSEEFLIFLKTNHSTDYYKAMSEDVKPEVINSILSNHSGYFSKWIKVPKSIRKRYAGVVPSEIIELAENGDIEALRRIENNQPAKPKKEENVDPILIFPPEKLRTRPTFIQAFVAGYMAETALRLAAEREWRDSLRDRALTNSLTTEEKVEWRKSRERSRDAIKKDFAENQPEKMLIHLLGKYNRNKITTKELMPQLADLLQKIRTEKRQDKLREYLERRPIRAKIAHFRADVLELMSATVLAELPKEDRDKYLLRSLPIKKQLKDLVDMNNRGASNEKINEDINKLVKHAQRHGVGLDLSGHAEGSHHPMSNDLRQRLMAACCANNVAYRSLKGEHVNLNSEYVRSLPEATQAVIASRDIALSKEKMVKQRDFNVQKKVLMQNLSMLRKGGRLAS